MIPEEAVEAALSAIFAETQALSEFNRGVWTPTIKTILEAALPYLTVHHPVADWPDIPRSRK